jgi:hypothetical protein
MKTTKPVTTTPSTTYSVIIRACALTIIGDLKKINEKNEYTNINWQNPLHGNAIMLRYILY